MVNVWIINQSGTLSGSPADKKTPPVRGGEGKSSQLPLEGI